jgi:excisionase family DNA binding protein
MVKQNQPAESAPPDSLSPQAAAALLNVPSGTLAQWRSSGRVPLPYLKLGGLIRYRRADLEAFVAANLHGGG